VPQEYKERTWKGNQAYRTFLVDGFLAGFWRPEETKERVTVTLQPFGTLTREQRAALEEEAQRTTAVVSPGRTCDVRFGTV
jgi:putative SOS response-associated peptidase YedK